LYVNKEKALTLLVFLALPNPIYFFLLFIFLGVVDRIHLANPLDPSIKTIPVAARNPAATFTDGWPKSRRKRRVSLPLRLPLHFCYCRKEENFILNYSPKIFSFKLPLNKENG
jgi:hypothetical protein